MFILTRILGDKINVIFNKYVIALADLNDWLERQCRPKIKLGRQKFRRYTASKGRHFVPTCFIVDSEGWINRNDNLKKLSEG